MREVDFHKLVAAWLRDSFADVEHEVRLDKTYHRPDFIAYTPFNSYVIEVEDSWDSIYDGLGQADMYAAETGHIPILVFPADEIDVVEYELLEDYEHAPIIETV